MIVRPGMTTFTVIVHRGSADPAAQLLPGAVLVSVMATTWPPAGYGSPMRSDPVIVTVAPTGTSPVHTAPAVPIDSVPELAAWLPALLSWPAVLVVAKSTLIP